MSDKPKKIEVAIRDTELRLENVKMEMRLLSRERDTLEKQLEMLKIIDAKKEYE